MLTPDLNAINESVIYITLNDNITYARIKRTDYEALLDEIKRLYEFNRYIEHDHWCPTYHQDGKCTCGLDDMLPFKE